LRKIEREPAEAPQTSAAIRALERARRNRGKALLENSRAGLKLLDEKKQAAMAEQKKQIERIAEINNETSAPQSIFQPSVVDETPAVSENNGKPFAKADQLQTETARKMEKKKTAMQAARIHSPIANLFPKFCTIFTTRNKVKSEK
jgi:hypothetical protein